MTKDEYGDFVLRYKGCGACFPMYHTLNRFEKMWFTAIQKDVADLEKENAELKKQLEMSNKVYNDNLDYSHHIEEQLTKAKELLERLLITSCNSDVLNLLPNCSEVLRVRVEAEQFLKEVEK